ncbi:MAG: BTAD domain-containing putative transcriptional regulator [Mycobacteriales bacterium]
MEFRVLGQVEALADGHALDIGHARQRSVLAVLLTEANRVVAVDDFVDRIWGAMPAPRDPRAVLRTYLWHLRRELPAAKDIALVRQPPGYKLVVDERYVDLHRFRELLSRTETAGDDERAAELIEQALRLWRGEPFAGLDTPWINTTRHNLLLLRRTARLELTDIHLRSGRHAALLTPLTEHAAEHPLDERVAGQLMLALYRSGRPADSLAEYRRIHQQLADELGTDPSPALRQLHQRILTADPSLSAVGARRTAGLGRPAVAPRQLPAAPRLFTGRERELVDLSTALDHQVDVSGTLLISGFGGTGKTWLALHWARQNLDRFPDGQLHVDLRGFASQGQPVTAEAAIRGFLDVLGVDPAALPADLDAQVGLYRSLLADKRMLIMLDDAYDIAQVTALLPGSPGCTTVVTSRNRLTGLIAGHGAVPVHLDVLPEDEARLLLTRYLGHERVTAEPDALADLLEFCAGLPLALGIMAARALAQEELPLSVLADELRDASARLDALTTDDLSASVRTAMCRSYDALGPDAARALRVLALAPGPDIGLPAAARLLSRPRATARTLLSDLENASLIRQRAAGRYHMHDLVRLHAAARAERDCAGTRRTDA